MPYKFNLAKKGAIFNAVSEDEKNAVIRDIEIEMKKAREEKAKKQRVEIFKKLKFFVEVTV